MGDWHPHQRRWRSALHEAAHAIGCTVLFRTANGAEIYATGGGRCWFPADIGTFAQVTAISCAFFAEMRAGDIGLGDVGWRHDVKQIRGRLAPVIANARNLGKRNARGARRRSRGA